MKKILKQINEKNNLFFDLVIIIMKHNNFIIIFQSYKYKWILNSIFKILISSMVEQNTSNIQILVQI